MDMDMDMMGMSQITSVIQSKPTSPFDLFGVFAIEVAEEIQIAPIPKLSKDVMVDTNLFKGIFSPIEGAFYFVDPHISFDILLGFVFLSNVFLMLHLSI